MTARDRWGSWRVRRNYSREGWSDAGEEAAFAWLSDALSDSDVLDLGIGGGRTTSILRESAGTYIGIDSSAGMIRLASRRQPGADIRHGDARHLDSVPDATCDVVMFSNNGIDAVGHADRPLVIDEAWRVLRPGGLFQFSSFNVDGQTRWGRPDLSALRRPTDRPPHLAPIVMAKRSVDTAFSYWHERRSRGLTEIGDDWAVVPLQQHEFRFAVHFIRLGAAVRELRQHGFETEGMWSPDGAQLDSGAEQTNVEYVHFVARKLER